MKKNSVFIQILTKRTIGTKGDEKMGYALPAEEPESSLVKGTVTGVGMNDGAMLVRTPRGIVRAERAAGCLLKPRCGDTVLTAFLPGGEAWVTCVLTRAEAETEAELALPDRTALRAHELSIEAEKAGVAARHISMEGTILSLGGGLLLQGFAAVQDRCAPRRRADSAQGGTLRRALRAHGRARRAQRGAYAREERDQLPAARRNADVRAEAMLDLDGERIKVG